MRTVHFTEGALTMLSDWEDAQVISLSGKIDDVATSVVITSRKAPGELREAGALLQHRLDERAKISRRFQVLRAPVALQKAPGATCTSQLLHDEAGMVLVNEAAFFVQDRLLSITTTGLSAGQAVVEAEARRLLATLKFRA